MEEKQLITAIKDGNITDVKRFANNKTVNMPHYHCYLKDDCQFYKPDYPLHMAVKHNQPTIIKELIKQGADKGLVNKDEKTAYQLAQEYKHTRTIINLLCPDDIKRVYIAQHLSMAFIMIFFIPVLKCYYNIT